MRTLLLLTLVSALPAAAWTEEGHARVARATLDSLPAELAFLRGYRARAAHHAVEPDIAGLAPALAARERPDHYLDFDLLPAGGLPAKRKDYEAWLRAAERDASRVGALLYRIEEEAERLTLLFAEHRRAPKSAILRQDIAAQIGKLSHYTADLVQPLHTTRDFDGRGGKRTGIHLAVDSWLGRLDAAAVSPRSAEPIADLRAAGLERLRAAHARVDAVYRAHAAAPEGLSPEAASIAQDCAAAAVEHTTAVVLTAWARSAKVELPGWVPVPGR